jgi:hypothetical protein
MTYGSVKVQKAMIKQMLQNRSIWLYRPITSEWQKTILRRRRRTVPRDQDRIEHITFSIVHDLIEDRK